MKESVLDHELLSAGRERSLLRRARSKDLRVSRGAREQLVRHNLRLVVRTAGRFYLPPGMERDDLVQAGVTGLMRAIERFDPGRGCRFSTYAVPWIRQSIGRQIENTGSMIRLPVALQQEMVRLRRTEAALALSLGREPTAEEIARESGLDDRRLEALHHARTIGSHTVALDATDEATVDLFDRLASDEPGPAGVAVAKEARTSSETALAAALAKLPEEEARVLRLRFGLDTEEDDASERTSDEGLTLAAIGALLGGSPEYVRRREQAGLDNLRRSLPSGGRPDTEAA